MRSETVFGELLGNGGNLLVLEGLGLGGDLLLLVLVVSLRLDLSLLFNRLDDLSLVPSDMGSKISENAEVRLWLESQNLEGLWHDHSLLLVVWEWDSLENLELLESSLTSGGLVWGHASENSPEDSGWGSVMDKLSSWVGVV